MPNDIFCS